MSIPVRTLTVRRRQSLALFPAFANVFVRIWVGNVTHHGVTYFGGHQKFAFRFDIVKANSAAIRVAEAHGLGHFALPSDLQAAHRIKGELSCAVAAEDSNTIRGGRADSKQFVTLSRVEVPSTVGV